MKISIDATARGKPWSRYYERAVAADHANTLLCTAWGRNVENALRKAHDQAGFEYLRFHGILNDDIGVYSEDGSGAAVYDWRRFDQVYDAIAAAQMRPIVEISFMPSALASNAAKVQPLLWYNKASPSISPPRDWKRWKDFMADIVRHLEQRYGADEVRRRWYFEVWNEPSWMYSLGDAGYSELYINTAAGLFQGDPEVRVGGPAGSSIESPLLIPALIKAARASHVKLDFITYHVYGSDDHLTTSNAVTAVRVHRNVMSLVKDNHFTGEVINDEFGSTSRGDPIRDNESSASFIARTVLLIGTDPSVPPPSALSYWTVSDLYEEFDTGSALAYREGNYGLLLKGDPRFSESFDVAKPAYNAFRLLHMMGDVRLAVSGGTTGDGINAAATSSADGKSLQILVYDDVAGGAADSAQSTRVSLTVEGAALTGGSVRVRRYVVDRTHANSHTAWVGMNKPLTPTREQWIGLRDAARLCYYETLVDAGCRSFTLDFPQYVYGVSLIEVAAPAR